MKKMMLTWLTVASLLMGCSGSETSVKGTYRNPVIYADVPDMSVTRAGELYDKYHYAFNARWTCYEIKRLGELGNSELCLR